jgi:hypothetical protein
MATKRKPYKTYPEAFKLNPRGQTTITGNNRERATNNAWLQPTVG